MTFYMHLNTSSKWLKSMKQHEPSFWPVKSRNRLMLLATLLQKYPPDCLISFRFSLCFLQTQLLQRTQMNILKSKFSNTGFMNQKYDYTISIRVTIVNFPTHCISIIWSFFLPVSFQYSAHQTMHSATICL